MADILLIKPHSGETVVPPLALGYLASSLKMRGISSQIIHCAKDGMDVSDVVRLVRENGIDLVGVSCCSSDHPWLSSLAAALESLPQVRMIVGGPHATGLAGRLMGLVPGIDFIVRAEAELALPELLLSVMNGDLHDSSLALIPNLVWRDSLRNIVENSIELPQDLDALAFPDWDQMAPSEYVDFTPHGGFGRASLIGQLLTTRGCPCGCSFCAADLMHGRRIRRRSPESVVEEIRYLVEAHGVGEIQIQDDNFTVNRDHLVNVCTSIRENDFRLHFAMPNGVRLDRLDDEILRELQATGFYMLSVGIESGSQATLKRMNKALDLRMVEETIARIRKYGFQIRGFFIIGYPGESGEDIEQTIQYATSLDLDRAYFHQFIPLPGTAEFRLLEEKGEIDVTKLIWENFQTKGATIPPYVPEGMTSDELQEYGRLAYRRFYLRSKIMMRMLRDLRISSPKHLGQVVWNLLKLNLSYFL
jgi:radical SAM superfamily enzyme YgiQ (UPF0313 family)